MIQKIDRVNDDVRLFQLRPVEGENIKVATYSIPVPKSSSLTGFQFLPGQWLDVYVPGIPKAGGFTITSPPRLLSTRTPYLELAIQKSPSNPPAAWLWQPESSILESELQVRVGGSFFWPSKLARSAERRIRRAVFVAGGVGINPLISMVSTLEHVKKESGELGFSVKFLYTTRDPGSSRSPTEILFLERLQSIFRTLGTEGELHLFLTPSKNTAEGPSTDAVGFNDKSLSVQRRRITQKDLIDTLGPVEERPETVCYICGVPEMTDEFVEKARRAEGIGEENVLFEKWW